MIILEKKLSSERVARGGRFPTFSRRTKKPKIKPIPIGNQMKIMKNSLLTIQINNFIKESKNIFYNTYLPMINSS